MTQEQQTQKTNNILQLVGFELGNEKFGVDILSVKEIIRTVEITRVPRAPDFVEGIINLRGEVIPIIDLRLRLGVEKKAFDKTTRLIVVELDSQQVGFVVDVVSQVLRLPKETIEPPPDMVTGVDSAYLEGVIRVEDHLLMLLDLKRILSHNEQRTLKDVA
jgi:purine-binding chemotaxis protein CheW